MNRTAIGRDIEAGLREAITHRHHVEIDAPMTAADYYKAFASPPLNDDDGDGDGGDDLEDAVPLCSPGEIAELVIATTQGDGEYAERFMNEVDEHLTRYFCADPVDDAEQVNAAFAKSEPQ
jgi:hypothetical protein